eukprot:gene10383-12751_t
MNDKLSFFEGTTTPDDILQDLTIYKLLLENVKRDPNKIAIILEHSETLDAIKIKQYYKYQQSTLTYSELYDEINYLCHGLIDLGLRKGDFVSIWSQNRLEIVLLYYSLAILGVISMNFHPLIDDEEFKHVMELTNCKALFFSDHGFECKKNDHLRVLKKFLPTHFNNNDSESESFNTTTTTTSTNTNDNNFPNLKFVIPLDSTVEEEDSSTNSITFQYIMKRGKELATKGTIDLEDHISKVSTHDPYCVILTSGSTGKPKLVLHSQYAFLNNMYLYDRVLGFTSNDILGNVGKSFLATGKIHFNMLMVEGATMVFVCGQDQIYPEGFMRQVQQYGITTASGAPVFFFNIVYHPEISKYNLSTWKKGAVYSFPLPLPLGECIRRLLGNGILHSYGMSENMLTISTFPTSSNHQFIRTIGKVLAHCSAKVVNHKKEIVPIGEIGQLVIKSYSTMESYMGDPIKTQDVLVDGWLFTGDLSKFDYDGNCMILGRLDDIIDCGNQKYSTKEIEDILSAHPKIKDIQVFGVPNLLPNSDLISAWIKLKPGQSSLTVEELNSYFQDYNVSSKLPKYIEIVSEYPLSESLKPMKRIMRELTFNKLVGLKTL